MEYSNSRVSEIIGEYIHSERDRNLLKRRMIDGVTFERLAEEFTLSVSQVKRIIWRETGKICRQLEKDN